MGHHHLDRFDGDSDIWTLWRAQHFIEIHFFASAAAGFSLGTGVNVPALGGRVHPNPAGSAAGGCSLGLSSPFYSGSSLARGLGSFTQGFGR